LGVLGFRRPQGVVFFRNDPKVIHAQHGTGTTQRKPDVILAFIADVLRKPDNKKKRRRRRKKKKGRQEGDADAEAEREAESVIDLYEASAAAACGEIMEFVEWDNALNALEFKLGTKEQRKQSYMVPRRYEHPVSGFVEMEPLDVDAEEAELMDIAEDSGKISTPETLSHSSKDMMFFSVVACLS
jgi:hypothetical protein